MQFCENKQIVNFIFQDFDFDFKDISEETDSEMIETGTKICQTWKKIDRSDLDAVQLSSSLTGYLRMLDFEL